MRQPPSERIDAMQPAPLLSAKHRFRPVVERLERRELRAADGLAAVDLGADGVGTGGAGGSDTEGCVLGCPWQTHASASAGGDENVASAPDTGSGPQLSLALEPAIDGVQSPQTVVAGLDPTVDDAAIAALADGQHAMAYVQPQQDEYQILFRRTLADGTPGPTAQQVATVAAASWSSTVADSLPVQVRLAALGHGGWVVAWTDGDQLFAQAYDASDQPLGEPVQQTVSPSDGVLEIELLPVAEDGGFLLAWNESDGSIVARAFNAAAEETASRFLLLHASADTFIVELEPQILAAGTALQWTVLDRQTMEPLARQWGVMTGIAQPITASQEALPEAFAQPPWILQLTDDRYAIVAMEYADPGDVMLVRIRDAAGNVLREHRFSIGDGATTSAETTDASAAALWGGGLAVGWGEIDETTMESSFVTQLFNNDGEPVPSQQIVPLGYRSHAGGLVTALRNGGYASYWIDTALDGATPVVATQTLRAVRTPLVVQLDDPAQTIDPATSTIEIQGLPANATLSHGTRTSPTTWTVSAVIADRLMIWSDDALPVMSLTAQWLDGATQQTLAVTAVTLGTDKHDTIDQAHSSPWIDGRQGMDTVVYPYAMDGYQFDSVDAHSVAVRYDDALLQHLVDVEFVVFGEQRWAIGDLIEQPAADPIDLPPEMSDGVEGEPDSTPDPDSTADPNTTRATPLASNAIAGIFSQATVPVPPLPPRSMAFGGAASAGAPFHAPTPRPSEFGQMYSGGRTAEPGDAGDGKRDQPPAQRAKSEAKLQGEAAKAAVTERGQSAEAAMAGGVSPEAAAVVGQLPDSVVQVNDPRLPTPPPLVAARSLPQLAANPVLPPSRTPRVYSGALQLNTATSDTNARPAQAPRIAAATPAIPLRPPPVKFASQWLTVVPAFDSQQLFEQIDEVQQQTLVDAEDKQLVAGTAVVLATGFSLAQIAWLLRGSVLITKLMSSMPIWFAFDPLPILNSASTLALDVPDPALPDESLLDIATR